MAVLAVRCEPLSGLVKFPDHRENTAKFTDFGLEISQGAPDFGRKFNRLPTEFPSHQGREICWRSGNLKRVTANLIPITGIIVCCHTNLAPAGTGCTPSGHRLNRQCRFSVHTRSSERRKPAQLCRHKCEIEPMDEGFEIGFLHGGARPNPKSRRCVPERSDVVGHSLLIEQRGHGVDELRLCLRR